jgi:hypothetical protein
LSLKINTPHKRFKLLLYRNALEKWKHCTTQTNVCLFIYEHNRMSINAWWNWCSQFCSQQLKSTILVPELSPFFCAKDADSCWFVDKINSCLHLVDILACKMFIHKKWPNEDIPFFLFLFFIFPPENEAWKSKITWWKLIFTIFAGWYLLHPQTLPLLVQYLLGRLPPQLHLPKARYSISAKKYI